MFWWHQECRKVQVFIPAVLEKRVMTNAFIQSRAPTQDWDLTVFGVLGPDSGLAIAVLLSRTLCACKCTCSLYVCYTVGEDAAEAFTHDRAKWLPLSSLWLPDKCECLLCRWAPSAKQSSLCRSCVQPPQGPVAVSVDKQDSSSRLSEL